MQDYSLERVGIPNLDFTGDLIGQSEGKNPAVKIYRTKALKYVGQLRADQKFSAAQHSDTPIQIINWFKAQNGGSVSPMVEDAIEDAAKHDDAFKTAWNEHID